MRTAFAAAEAGIRKGRNLVQEHVRLFGKGSKERQATITPELYRRILATFPQGEYLFTTEKGDPFNRGYIAREIDPGRSEAMSQAPAGGRRAQSWAEIWAPKRPMGSGRDR